MALTLLVAALATPQFAPQVLAFPYRAEVGRTAVYSETPIAPRIRTVLAGADRLRHASAIDGPAYGHRLFLTDGGWRWHWLSFQAAGGFAQSRALSTAIVFNRSSAFEDRIFDGQAVGGERSLSGVIAHEQTHGLIRARYGLFADTLYPAWLREGYCDVVAGGGSLSDAEAATLERSEPSHPALLYYHGRKRVEALLRANGGSVDRVFAGARAW